MRWIDGLRSMDEKLPFLSGRFLDLEGCSQTIAVRVSFTGELGYELYYPIEHHGAVYKP